MMKIVCCANVFVLASTTTSKTVIQTQAKPICSGSMDSFLSFTSSVLVFSCLVEVVFLSALTFVVSATTVCLSSSLLKSPSTCPFASNEGFPVRLSDGFLVS